MSLTDFEDQKKVFDRLERLEDLARENDEHYWKLGAGLDDDTDQYDTDSDYLVDDRTPQNDKTKESDETIGRHI